MNIIVVNQDKLLIKEESFLEQIPYIKEYIDFSNSSKNDFSIYIPYKDWSKKAIFISEQEEKKENSLLKIKERIIKTIKEALESHKLIVNVLSFYSHLFLILIDEIEIEEITEDRLKCDIKAIKESVHRYKSSYENNKSDITPSEFSLITMLGFMSIYAGCEKEKSFLYASDLYTIIKAYDIGYVDISY